MSDIEELSDSDREVTSGPSGASTPPKKKMKIWYKQAVRQEWLKDDEFQDWLKIDPEDKHTAICTVTPS